MLIESVEPPEPFTQVAVSNTDSKLALQAVEDAFQLEIARTGTGIV